MTRKPPKNPLLVVTGATGTGKSQLAVSLATRFNGEIINADAVQMYDGLPIITNKITVEEQNGIPHHLLGFIALGEEPWRVGQFKRKASQIIKEIRSRGRLPILVGGTHYYTQSLLLGETLVTNTADDEEKVQTELSNQEISERYPILEGPTQTMIERLKEIDPVMAHRWHPNDRRKIRRSLEIFLLTGKKASDVYADQKQNKSLTKNDAGDIPEETTSNLASEDISPLLFWVHAESETLKARLDGRVEKMVEAGLLDEVKTMDSFLHSYTELGKDVDQSRGVWVSIGWKQFEQYLYAVKAGTEPQEKLDQLLALSIEQTKTATRQYAKRQTRWIRLKLIPALLNQKILDKLYLLDGTDISSWSEAVLNPAIDTTTKFLAGDELPDPSQLSSAAREFLAPERSFEFADRRDLWVRHECEICHTVLVTEEGWQAHLKGRLHRRLVKKQQKLAAGGRFSIANNERAPSPGETSP